MYVCPLISAYKVIKLNSAVIDKISSEEIARSVLNKPVSTLLGQINLKRNLFLRILSDGLPSSHCCGILQNIKLIFEGGPSLGVSKQMWDSHCFSVSHVQSHTNIELIKTLTVDYSFLKYLFNTLQLSC